MPVDYRIYPDFGIVQVVFSGLVRAIENIAAVEDYRNSAGYDPLLHILMDLADCSFPSDLFADMMLLKQRLGLHYRTRDPRSHTAIYAPGNVAFGMARLFRSAANPDAPNPVKAFRHAGDALRFVDLDPSRPEVARLLRPATSPGRLHGP